MRLGCAMVIRSERGVSTSFSARAGTFVPALVLCCVCAIVLGELRASMLGWGRANGPSPNLTIC
jgi:hypothetical protein